MTIICDTYKIPTWEADQLIEAWDDDIPLALDGAIDVCRERARLYCIPANWTAFRDTDGSIIVKRYRHKREAAHA